jgi:hypothetical protein
MESRERASCVPKDDRAWIRSLAVSSLITGAVLLARGKRKAGFTVTIVGAAIAVLEDPESVRAGWNNLPSYIDAGKQMLNRLENFLEDLIAQGDRVRGLLERVER